MTRKSKQITPNPTFRDRTQSVVARRSRAHYGDSTTDFGSRQRILESASRLFECKGYASTSVREIAAAATIAKPAIYYYFGSKEGLYSALLEDCGAKINQVLEQVNAVEGTPWEKIECLCHGLILLMRRNPFVRRFIEATQFGPFQDLPLSGHVHCWTKIETALWKLLIQGQRERVFQFEQVEDGLSIVTGIVLISCSGRQRHSGQALGHEALSRTLILALNGIGTSPTGETCVPPKITAALTKRRRRAGAGQPLGWSDNS